MAGILTSVFYTFRDSLLPLFTGGMYTYMGKRDNGRASRIDGLIGRFVFLFSDLTLTLHPFFSFPLAHCEELSGLVT